MLNEVALIQVVRKLVSFQDRSNENTPIFPGIKILWRQLWIVITAIENLRFEIYFRFSWIPTYRIFYFLRRLFAKDQTVSS